MEQLIKQATVVRDVLNHEASKDKKSNKVHLFFHVAHIGTHVLLPPQPVYPKWQLGSFIGAEAS